MAHSAMQHQFAQVPKAQIPRSQFNRSHTLKTTFDAGYLVPIYCDEALPGDTHNCHMTAFARLTTPIVPMMDNLTLDTFFFAVPLRLIWANFKKFMGEQASPGASTSFICPIMTATATTGYLVSSIHDHFGLPTGIPGYTHTSFWHRAYNLIYQDWFRDENLQAAVALNTGDTADAPTDYTLLRRGKRHDYFTSCLPWAQKGTAVALPLGSTAEIKYNPYTTSIGPMRLRKCADDAVLVSNPIKSIANGVITDDSGTINAFIDPNTKLYADLSTATSSTINALRQAFQIQKLYERDARGGTRYTEMVRSHFGVTSPDSRLQRPEYLGGGTSKITIHPIAQTSSTDATTPQGNLAAMGVVTAHGHGFVKSFTEHCVLLGLACVRADVNYQQGLNKMFSRSTRWDFYWPALSSIGEQAVLNQEIYTVNPTGAGAAQNAAAFGYQERYAEYRFKPNQITGQFRSTYSGHLDMWHLAQEFTSLPVLDATFIVENPPMARVLAVANKPHFYFDAYFDLKSARPMPTYGVPGLIDHF